MCGPFELWCRECAFEEGVAGEDAAGATAERHLEETGHEVVVEDRSSGMRIVVFEE